MRIVFLDRETIGPGITIRRPAFEHEWVEYERTAQDEVVGRLGDAQVAITNKVRINRDAVAGLSGLRMIAVAATGVDVIDLEACRERQIVVSNVRGYATHTVPERPTHIARQSTDLAPATRVPTTTPSIRIQWRPG